MHLAGFARERTVGRDDERRVESERASALLVARRMHRNAGIDGELRYEFVGRSARERLGCNATGLRPTLVVGDVGEPREFGQANEVGAFVGRGAHALADCPRRVHAHRVSHASWTTPIRTGGHVRRMHTHGGRQWFCGAHGHTQTLLSARAASRRARRTPARVSNWGRWGSEDRPRHVESHRRSRRVPRSRRHARVACSRWRSRSIRRVRSGTT